jgi:hypothetical protein
MAPRSAELRNQGPPPSAKPPLGQNQAGSHALKCLPPAWRGAPSHAVEHMSELSLSRFRRCFCSNLRLSSWHPLQFRFPAWKCAQIRRGEGESKKDFQNRPKNTRFYGRDVPFFGHFWPGFDIRAQDRMRPYCVFCSFITSLQVTRQSRWCEAPKGQPGATARCDTSPPAAMTASSLRDRHNTSCTGTYLVTVRSTSPSTSVFECSFSARCTVSQWPGT